MALRKSDHNYPAARKLRKKMSLPEGLLGRELRRQRGNVKIRRQHPVGTYVLDFYCAAAKLGIEIDGIVHDMGDRPARDAARDAWLEAQGIEILRYAAKDVLKSPDDVASSIVALCKDRCA